MICPLALVSCPPTVCRHFGREDYNSGGSQQACAMIWKKRGIIQRGWAEKFWFTKIKVHNSTWGLTTFSSGRGFSVPGWTSGHHKRASSLQLQWKGHSALTWEDVSLLSFQLTPGTLSACFRYVISPPTYLKVSLAQSPLSQLFPFE